MQSTGMFDPATHAVLTRAIAQGDVRPDIPFAAATAVLTGPVLFRSLTAVHDATGRDTTDPKASIRPAALLAAITCLTPASRYDSDSS